MKAVILAGGYGKRLRPLTDTLPKNLVLILDKPMILWQIEWLKSHNIRDILLLTGYLGDKIREFLGDGSEIGVNIEYSHEEEPLGTGGALLNAHEYLYDEDLFFMLNGDIITNLDIKRLLSIEEAFVGALALVPLPSPYGIIVFDEKNVIKSFVEKPLLEDYWINAGVYLFRKEIFKYLPKRGNIEQTTFPKLASEGKLKAIRYTDVTWKNIDTYKDIEEASTLLRNIKF